MSKKHSRGDFWATPQARDYKNPGSPTGARAKRKRSQGWTIDLNDQVILWSQEFERWKAAKAAANNADCSDEPKRNSTPL